VLDGRGFDISDQKFRFLEAAAVAALYCGVLMVLTLFGAPQLALYSIFK